jgi:hypothetical protein
MSKKASVKGLAVTRSPREASSSRGLSTNETFYFNVNGFDPGKTVSFSEKSSRDHKSHEKIIKSFYKFANLDTTGSWLLHTDDPSLKKLFEIVSSGSKSGSFRKQNNLLNFLIKCGPGIHPRIVTNLPQDVLITYFDEIYSGDEHGTSNLLADLCCDKSVAIVDKIISNLHSIKRSADFVKCCIEKMYMYAIKNNATELKNFLNLNFISKNIAPVQKRVSVEKEITQIPDVDGYQTADESSTLPDRPKPEFNFSRRSSEKIIRTSSPRTQESAEKIFRHSSYINHETMERELGRQIPIPALIKSHPIDIADRSVKFNKLVEIAVISSAGSRSGSSEFSDEPEKPFADDLSLSSNFTEISPKSLSNESNESANPTDFLPGTSEEVNLLQRSSHCEASLAETTVLHSDQSFLNSSDYVGGVPLVTIPLSPKIKPVDSLDSVYTTDDSSEDTPVEYPVLREFIFDAVELNQNIIKLKQQIEFLTRENTELKAKLSAIYVLSKPV